MISKPDERTRIQRALIEATNECAYRDTTVESVIERAGIDEAVFFRHFDDLEDCLYGTLQMQQRRLLDDVAAAGSGIPTWRDRLRATAYALFRFLWEDEKVTHFLVVAARSGGERVQLVWAAGFEQLFDIIDEGRAELDDPDSLSRGTAESVGGGIFSQLYAAIGRGPPFPTEEEIVPQLMYTAVLPYLGPEAALEELHTPPPGPAGTGKPVRFQSPVPFRHVSTRGSDGKEVPWPELGPLPGGHHGLSPEQVAESQHERLLSAVAHVVADRGYRATTITEIVKTASVSTRIFYEHFSSKEECFLAAFDAVFAHLEELLAAAVKPLPDWPDRTVAALRTALRFFAAEPDLARLCLLESVTATPAIASRFREAVLVGIPLLEAGRTERPDGQSLPESTEDSLLGGFIALTSRSILAGSESLEALLPDLIEFGLSPYVGPEQAKKLALEAAAAPPA